MSSAGVRSAKKFNQPSATNPEPKADTPIEPATPLKQNPLQPAHRNIQASINTPDRQRKDSLFGGEYPYSIHVALRPEYP
jgi:hypothetical protein